MIVSEIEKINKLIDDLKICSLNDIHICFSPVCDLLRFVTKEEKQQYAQLFYDWANENIELNPAKLGYAEFLMAHCYFMNVDHESSLHFLSKASKHFEEQNIIDGLGLCDMLTGAIYRTFGNFDLALKKLWNGFEVLSKSDHYPIFLSACANSMANIYLELNNYTDALKLFTITYDESKNAKDYYFEIYALQGLGKVNLAQNKFTEAKEFLAQALQLAEKNKSPLHIANATSEMANFYFQTGNLSEAEKLNKEALQIRENNQFTLAAVTSCNHLGEIYIKQNRWDEALEVLNKGLALAEKTNVKLKVYEVNLLLSKVYESKKDIPNCLYHFKLYHDLHEQVAQADSARKLADAKLLFDAEQTKKDNVIIKKQKKEIQEKNIQLQETIDELTLAKISKKAKALTLIIAIILFVLEDSVLHFALRMLSSENYYLSILVKIGIIFSLKPIENAIEHYLLKKVIWKKKQYSSISSGN